MSGSTAIVSRYYVYCIDPDFGPFFLKFCTYFPYTAKLCLNGHEYAKQQLDNRASVMVSELWIGITFGAGSNPNVPRERPRGSMR